MSRIIVGLTGAFGSGTTFLADNYFVPDGYIKCSLSSILKKLFIEEYDREYSSREELQKFGNKKREVDSKILAEQLDMEYIVGNDDKSFVIESIRNPAEINYSRDKYPEFILVGVFADYETRWERVKATYNGSKDAFDKDEQKDQGTFEPIFGQKVSDSFFESDLVISNNNHISCNPPNSEHNNMKERIEAYIRALKEPATSNPTLKEMLMAAAYTSGRRSKCTKRKVGAVIADKYDRIISSGFNGVPFGLRECKSAYGSCYRDIKREELGKRVGRALGTEDPQTVDTIKKSIKLLELCRALHGEESAILNLVGRGMNMEDTTIYVTT